MHTYSRAYELYFVILQPILRVKPFAKHETICTSFKKCRPELGHLPTKRQIFHP